jgi:tetratricopeptide (TPR) repeat protein
MKPSQRINFYWLLILMLLVTAQACSTKKNTWTRRTYHNLTSKYNVYWNGNESLKAGVADLRKSVEDDYSNVLRVFNYGTKAEAARINAQMERAIEKGAIGVQKHSMVFGGKEYVRWIDDSYLMMGKAHFYKQDYISARRTFEFVARQYSGNDITHTADLWLARTYIQLERLEAAEALLESLKSRSRTTLMPREVRENLNLVAADFFIASGRFNQAIVPLEQALKETSSKQLRTRALFILGQIHQRNGEKQKANNYFARVLKSNPTYAMAFEARINMARNFESGNSDSRELVKSLQKMLRDPKNDDYHGKIYAALADIALSEGRTEQAIDYLRLSVAKSSRNKQQQAASSLRLASMLFERNDYISSQAYYDTAVSSLNREFPGYDSIRNKAAVLSELVDNLNTINLQDSLLRVANMDSVSRIALIDGIIKKIREEQAKRELEEREMERNVLMNRESGIRGGGSPVEQSREWYFYNPNTLSFGYTEFLRKWGRRKLEDNWRISDKASMSSIGSESIALGGSGPRGTNQSDSATITYTETDRGYYLKDLPLTPEAKEASLSMIEEAYNNVGYIYKEKLNDYPRSIEAYNKLLNKFVDTEFRLQAWYALYRMHLSRNESSDANRYASLILQHFPNTDYARVIEDPEYFVKKLAQGGESLVLYEQTLQAYQNEEYFRVLLNTNRARTLYSNDVDLFPRFEFLRGVAMGKVYVVDSMVMVLENIVRNYQLSPVAPLAASILRSVNQTYDLNIDIPNLPGEQPSAAEPEETFPYTYEPSSGHLVMVIASTERVRIDPLRVRLSDFNTRNFRSANLNLRSLVLNDQFTLVTIGNFSDSREAEAYRISLAQSDYVFGGVDQNDYFVMPVSLSNYPVFYRQKDIQEYARFLKKNYP